jgi:hypothetical protein
VAFSRLRRREDRVDRGHCDRADEKRPVLTKATGAVKDVFRRIDWLKVAKKAGGLAVTAFTGIPTPIR